MDGEHDKALAERLPEDIELRSTAEAIDEDVLASDAREGALRPDAEPVCLPFRMGHSPHRFVGDGQAPPRGLLSDDVPHSDDREAEVSRDAQELVLPASRHAGHTNDLHAPR